MNDMHTIIGVLVLIILIVVIGQLRSKFYRDESEKDLKQIELISNGITPERAEYLVNSKYYKYGKS